MKLRFSATSPYVRKVMVTALEAGLGDRIEKVDTNVWDPATDIAEDNPLGKVPALTTDDGLVLCDSPVICEHLDSLNSGTKLIPAEGPARWRVLNLQALADGIMDAAVGQVIETKQRPEALRWDGWIARQKAKIGGALDSLEAKAVEGSLDGAVTVGNIAVGCALAYLDFRFAADDWRRGHPALAAWFEGFSQLPSMQASQPPA